MMKPIKPIKLALIALLLVVHIFGWVFTQDFRDNDPFFTEQLVYKLEDTDVLEELLIENDLMLLEHRQSGLITVEIGQSTDLEKLFSLGFAYNQNSEVARPPFRSSVDPYLKNQYAIPMMQTTEAWEITVGSAAVVVAIIDTGIDIGHTEFKNRIAANSYNSYTQTVGINAVADDHGHGTMVAGVIGAIKDNGVGIAGIAQNVQLMIIKANRPNEGLFSDSALIDGIYYAADNGADIINLSLGGFYLNTQTRNAIVYANSKGILVIAAAGNDGTSDIMYPAGFKETIAVSAIDQNKLIAPYSNFGAHIDLSAPGTDIITTARNNGYATASGTSFAAPQVAGVAALMLSHHVNLTLSDLTTRLLYSAVDLGEPGKDDYYGYGLSNTYAALTKSFVNLTFQTYEGDPIDPMIVPKGEVIHLPNATLKDHVFEGWFFDADFLMPWVNGESVANEDLTLHALFNASFHTVTYRVDGQIYDSVTVARGETFELPVIQKEGYIFIGWAIDDLFETMYSSEPLFGDLTLYAVIEPIVYYTVTLWDQDVIISEFILEQGTYLTVEPYLKEGYTFINWFIDETLTQVFEPRNIESNLNLYAQYEIITFSVTFETFEGEAIDELIVLYHDTFELPTAIKQGFFFIGWYLDIEFTQAYAPQKVTNDLVLYAYFAASAYLVTYYVDGLIYDEHYEVADTEFQTITPIKKGYEFMGWYLNALLTEPYTNGPIVNDLDLYAYFELKEYEVTFYDYDLTTVLSRIIVQKDHDFEIPSGPLKPDSLNFSYTFLRWSESVEFVSGDMDIFPLYVKILKPETIKLMPGVDTITQHQTWIDAGLRPIEPQLSIVIESNVQQTIVGRYAVHYHIYDQDIRIYTQTRMVRVIEEIESVDLTLNPGIDTIYVGQPHNDAGLKFEQSYPVVIESTVDTSKIGRYEITYSVSINGITYQKTRIIHVIKDDSLAPVAFRTYAIIRKEDDGYEI